MAPIGLKLCQNAFQTIPNVSFFDTKIFLVDNFFKLLTAIYPSNRAPIGLKLCQNAFQTIPNISFSDVKTFVSSNFVGLKNRFSSFWSGFGVATN